MPAREQASQAPTRTVPSAKSSRPLPSQPTPTSPAAPQPGQAPSLPPRNPGSRSTTMHYFVPNTPQSSNNAASSAHTVSAAEAGGAGSPPQPEPGQVPTLTSLAGGGQPGEQEMSRTLQLALQESREIAPSAHRHSAQAREHIPQEALFPDGSKNFETDEEENERLAQQLTSGITTETRLSDLTDAQILQLTQSLKDDAASSRPLISPIEPLANLEQEYEHGSARVVVKKLRWLERVGWRGVRRTRGDGDCFYRSLAFSYVERLLLAPDPALAVAMALSTLQDGRNLLDQAGFQELVYEDFYETLTTLITSIVSPPNRSTPLLSGPALLSAFQTAETSNSIVVYLRLLTSAYIRAHADDFTPYLFSPDTGEMLSVREFCEREVEASGKEADHVQEMALARALRIRVRIAYLDNSPAGGHSDGGASAAGDYSASGAAGGGTGEEAEQEKVDFVTFESEVGEAEGMHEIALLYRPGHFDVLETREVE